MATAAGRVRFAKEVPSSMEADLKAAFADPVKATWWQNHYRRFRAYAPYTLSGAPWFRSRAWAYRDMYAIYAGSAVAEAHPEWVLKDAAGRPLCIPYGPLPLAQLAGDIGNLGFRAHVRAELQSYADAGCAGFALDDVNHELAAAVSLQDSYKYSAPVNPRTGGPYSQATWEAEVAGFVEWLRGQFPDKELVPNVVWWRLGGEQNGAARRIVRAATTVHVERGFNDPALTPETFGRLFDWVDFCHAQGRGCWFDVQHETGANQGVDLAVATFLLASNGTDFVGTSQRYARSTLADWAGRWNIGWGAPTSKRVVCGGLLARSFERGYVTFDPATLQTKFVRI